MRTSNICKAVLVLALAVPFAAAQAAPGDNDAVAKARQEYEQAMKGHDVGLQNAMKIQLAVQISKARAQAGSNEKVVSGNGNSRSSANL
jgi:hypothetical protein